MPDTYRQTIESAIRQLEVDLYQAPPQTLLEQTKQVIAQHHRQNGIGDAHLSEQETADLLRNLRELAHQDALATVVSLMLLKELCGSFSYGELAHQIDVDLLATLLIVSEQLRDQSKQLASDERRALLTAGKGYVEQGVAVLNGPVQITAEAAMKAFVEFGQYYCEAGLKTAKETGYPLDVFGEVEGQPVTEDSRISPNIDSPEHKQGIRLMTQGYLVGRDAGYPACEMERLASYIIERNMASVFLPDADIQKRIERLSFALEITQTLGEHVVFATAVGELSTLLRQANQPDVAEKIIRKALDWNALEAKARKKLLTELASTLSDQHKFPEAEQIQRQLLEGKY